MPLWGSSAVDLARFHADAGTKLHQKGDLANALLHYTRAYQEFPDMPGLLANRGWLYYQQGHSGLALADLDLEIQLGPPDARVHEYRALVRLHRDDLEGALADASKVVAMLPDEPRVYSLRGRILADAGRLDRALDDCTFAVEIDSRYAEGFVTRGWVRFRESDVERGMQDAERALAIDPRNSDAWGLRGRLLLDRGDLEQAGTCYDRARRNPSQGGWSDYGMGIVQHLQASWGEAAESFEKSLAAAWGDPVLRDYAALHLWLSERWSGEDAEADDRFRDYFAARSRPAAGDWSGAIVEFLLGRRTEADLTSLADAAPEPFRPGRRSQIPYYSGVLKQLLGDDAAALRDFQSCVDRGVRSFFEWILARAELA